MFGNFQAKFNAPALYTTPDAPGRTISSAFGLVGIYATIAGGFETGYEKVLSEASAALLEVAQGLGANAVVGVRFDPSVSGFLVTGTAVILNT
ncbi:MAG TPA: heavy metal-binding domain-containing protein [Acidobacteriaceae bacterium]